MKKYLIILAILMFIFTVGVYSADTHENINMPPINETNESALFGCCSIVCQLDGNNSISSFRRDANYSADIHIEEIDWHGKPAIKQYKTDGKYFCQFIVTSDGWVIGYGGLDDGADNQRIENMTADMVLNNTISNSTLQRIQDIKHQYGRGHAVIKAPNGTYGVAMANTHFTGVLKPGQYISVPNKDTYIRNGNIKLDAKDKVKILVELERSDAYGLARRDITTFHFHGEHNDSFNGNITDVFLSNDDGSFYQMNTGGFIDNVYFNGTLFKKEDIPIAPNYTYLGTFQFEDANHDDIFSLILWIIVYIIEIVLIVIIAVFVIRLINKIRYNRRRRRRY